MVEAAHSLDRQTIVNELNDLIHLDFDAICAYEAAIARLSNSHFRERLQTFKDDHDRHTQNLADCVRSYGGKPATSGDFKKILTKGKVLLASLGSDQSILEAMRSNEDQTNAQYEKAIQKLADATHLADVLRRNLADERHHRQWLISTLDGLS